MKTYIIQHQETGTERQYDSLKFPQKTETGFKSKIMDHIHNQLYLVEDNKCSLNTSKKSEQLMIPGRI